MTSSPTIHAAVIGAILLSVNPLAHAAITTTDQSNAGITINGRIAAQSSNLGTLTTTETNTPETVTTTKSQYTVDGPSTQVVTPAQIGQPGSVDLVVMSQTYERTETRWDDLYAFHASSPTGVQADVKYLVYTADVLVTPTSHFASGYAISFLIAGKFTSTALTVPGLANPINVLSGPVLPSFYLAGANGEYQALNTTGTFSPEGTTYAAYGAWSGRGNTALSFLVAAGNGVSLDDLDVSLSLNDYAAGDLPLGAPVRSVLNTVPLPALPDTTQVPEPESAALALMGLLTTGIVLWRRRQSARQVA
jgi:PEP-CTERM motif